MLVRYFLSFFLLLLGTSFAQASAVGFKTVVVGQGGPRPLLVAMWYPTNAKGTLENIGATPVFYGQDVQKDAKPTQGEHALVVISHGYGGSWRNLSWLAVELAAQGYIVAAPDHPGTTTFNKDPVQAAMLWERPHDLSRVMDALLADPALAGQVNAGHMAAIGHSLGGWTVTALAGAQFDTARFAADCKEHADLIACSLTDELGLGLPELERDMHDRRIKGFVALDLGLARGFAPQSLENVQVPALVFAAGIDVGGLPAALESGYIVAWLPKTSSTYVEIQDAMHFSFMQLCKPEAQDLLTQEAPEDVVICRDGGIRGREAIHREITGLVLKFLSEIFPDD